MLHLHETEAEDEPKTPLSAGGQLDGREIEDWRYYVYYVGDDVGYTLHVSGRFFGQKYPCSALEKRNTYVTPWLPW